MDNLCETKTVIPMYQNLFAPNAAISSFTNAITCITPTIVLSNLSTSGIPPGSIFPNSSAVIGFNWFGPAPQASLSISTTYTAATAGVYTLIAKDLNNGCTSSVTTIISDNRIFPSVLSPGYFTVACPTGTVQLSPTLSGSMVNLTYSWSVPANANTSGNTTPTLTTNAPGSYSFSALNIQTGCRTVVTIDVWACVGLNESKSDLNALNIYPNPGAGLYTINLKMPGKNLSIKVLNALGQEVLRINSISGNNTINLQNEANGIYFVTILEDNKPVSVNKIIKQ
jgi:hypothetical protein